MRAAGVVQQPRLGPVVLQLADDRRVALEEGDGVAEAALLESEPAQVAQRDGLAFAVAELALVGQRERVVQRRQVGLPARGQHHAERIVHLRRAGAALQPLVDFQRVQQPVGRRLQAAQLVLRQTSQVVGAGGQQRAVALGGADLVGQLQQRLGIGAAAQVEEGDLQPAGRRAAGLEVGPRIGLAAQGQAGQAPRQAAGRVAAVERRRRLQVARQRIAEDRWKGCRLDEGHDGPLLQAKGVTLSLIASRRHHPVRG